VIGVRWLSALVVAGALYLIVPFHYVAAASRVMDTYRRDPTNWQHAMLAAATWSNGHLTLTKDDRLLAFSAGLLGWFSDATVINIDGLANEDWRQFRTRGGSIEQYCASVGATYYIDVVEPDRVFRSYRVEETIPFPNDLSNGYFIASVSCGRSIEP